MLSGPGWSPATWLDFTTPDETVILKLLILLLLRLYTLYPMTPDSHTSNCPALPCLFPDYWSGYATFVTSGLIILPVYWTLYTMRMLCSDHFVQFVLYLNLNCWCIAGSSDYNMRQIMWCWSVDAWREVKQFLVTGHDAGIIISHFCHVIETDHLHQYFHNVCCGSVLWPKCWIPV